ncbi:MAG TPA: magnesium transporter [Methanotrichaceae archaeon]|nr:magnesium transporter [Methanotrichaceae archaeon]
MSLLDEGRPVYPRESAWDYIEEFIPTAAPEDIASDVIRRLMESDMEWDSLTYIYVLNPDRMPVGMVEIEKLFAAQPADPMSRIMRSDIKTVAPYADQEEVVIKAITGDLDAIPVVDSEGKFMGAIDHDSILAILHYENVEDYLRLSGIRAVHPVVDIVKARALDLVRLRIPWLILGLIGGMLATIVINSFDQALEKEIALAFFIPVIVYMSAAVGTQTETIFIRSLSLEAFDVKRYALREGLIGLAMASILSILIFIFTIAYLQSIEVATIVSLAMLASIFAAVFIAILIPWMLSKLQKDPAFGSGPFATIIQDILSIVIYFTVATLVLFH